MKMPPVLRRFTRAAPGALNVFAYATDDRSAQTFIRTGPNIILDLLNSPDPAAGLLYVIQLHKSYVDTGIQFYSEALSPASAGRVAVGPIQLKGGDYNFNVAQTLGALTAYSFVAKFATNPIN